jgi:IS605 OrfB family transposase
VVKSTSLRSTTVEKQRSSTDASSAPGGSTRTSFKAVLAARQSRLTKGSRRWRTLNRSTRTQLRKRHHQILDILHTQTTALVSTLHASRVQLVVIGDVRNIRQNVDYGPSENQRIHQMVTGRVRRMITDKAERLGMRVVLHDEASTAQECPRCLHRHTPSGRVDACPTCGFRFHRDDVGAINIRRTYLDLDPVVGAMASPTGTSASLATSEKESPPSRAGENVNVAFGLFIYSLPQSQPPTTASACAKCVRTQNTNQKFWRRSGIYFQQSLLRFLGPVSRRHLPRMPPDFCGLIWETSTRKKSPHGVAAAADFADFADLADCGESFRCGRTDVSGRVGHSGRVRISVQRTGYSVVGSRRQ